MTTRPRNIHETIGLDTIAAVVDAFYNRIQQHPTLAEPFRRVTDWPEHKARLTHFWWLSLGGTRYRDDRYQVGPLHMSLGVTGALVDDWLALFRETLDAHLDTKLADEWYRRAELMGRSIRMLSTFDPNDPRIALGRRA